MKIDLVRIAKIAAFPESATPDEVRAMADVITRINIYDAGKIEQAQRQGPKPTLRRVKSCKVCGKEFYDTSNPPAKQTCSPDCRWEAQKRKNKNREGVNSVRTVKLWNEGLNAVDIAKRLGISRERVRQLLHKPENLGQLNEHPDDRQPISTAMIKYTCQNPNCGKEFEATRGSGRGHRFCTRECFLTAPPEIRFPDRKTPKSSEFVTLTLTCKGCGVAFERSQRLQNIHNYAGAKNFYCSRDCYLKQSKQFGGKQARTKLIIEKIQKELRDAKPPEGIQG